MEITNLKPHKRELLLGFISLLICLIPLDLFSKDQLLILYSGGDVFKKTIRSISEDLGDELNIFRMILNNDTTPAKITDKIKSVYPKLVVLMDNKSIALFKKYQDKLPAQSFFIPSISLMAINIEMATRELKNSYGISYEIPIVTSLVNLRSILDKPIKKVGIIHRQFLNDFISKNDGYCKSEGFELVKISLPDKGINFKKKIRSGLKTLIKEKKIDVLWVPNDNVLLTGKIIKRVWRPLLKKHKIPLIVGLEVFVNPELDFGIFAVLPDHISLGNQAAEIILELKDNNWKFEKNITFPPISIKKIINYHQARIRFNIKEENFLNVDKILKKRKKRRYHVIKGEK